MVVTSSWVIVKKGRNDANWSDSLKQSLSNVRHIHFAQVTDTGLESAVAMTTSTFSVVHHLLSFLLSLSTCTSRVNLS